MFTSTSFGSKCLLIYTVLLMIIPITLKIITTINYYPKLSPLGNECPQRHLRH